MLFPAPHMLSQQLLSQHSRLMVRPLNVSKGERMNLVCQCDERLHQFILMMNANIFLH